MDIVNKNRSLNSTEQAVGTVIMKETKKALGTENGNGTKIPAGNNRDWSNPGAEFRCAPFWAWNGEMTGEGIVKSLREIAKEGFGGVFVHPRPGLVNAYLSKEWFALWRIALDEAKRLGLLLYIYDENTYPTGYAGGHVMSKYPDCAARSVKVMELANGTEWGKYLNDPTVAEELKRPWKVYGLIEQEENGSLWDLSEWEREEQELYQGKMAVLLYQLPYSSAWYGGFPNPDLLRPEVTKALLESTYEAYGKYFGEDFGTWIPAVFSDEPGISPGNVNLEDPMVFPYSPYLAYEFYQRRGYELEDHMAALCLNLLDLPDGIEATKVRYDYYCTLQELWIENFAKPVHDWCDQHHLRWTGHFLDEHWPYPWGCASPAVMSMYEWMHWPGIDMLMTHMLKEDGTSPMLLSVKELESAGEQLGKERLLCECYGAGGWDASIADFKRIGDWLAVHGITFFNPHLILDSISGVRKYGHPQSFDWREPWWKEYKELNWYLGRLCALLSEGKRAAQILVLHPTTSWFLRKPQADDGNILWNYKEMAPDSPIRSYIGHLEQWMEAGLEYDLGDEFLLEKYGSIDSGTLRVGNASYSVIYIPKEMCHMRSATLHLLQEAQKAGIAIYQEGQSFAYLDGRKREADMEFTEFKRCSAKIFTEKMLEKGCVTIQKNNHRITAAHRITGENHRYFLINSTPDSQYAKAVLHGNSVKKLNLFTGEEEHYTGILTEYGVEIEVLLNAGESLMLECREENIQETNKEAREGVLEHAWDQNAPISQSIKSAASKTHRSDPLHIHPDALHLYPDAVNLDGPNVWYMDYGILTLRGKTYGPIHVGKACDKIYKAHGWEQNPWDMAIQYQDRIISRNEAMKKGGFTFTYCFDTVEYPEQVQAAVEHPELVKVSINGHLIEPESGQFWLDAIYGIYEIGPYLHIGSNELTLTADTFDLRLELQPVYLLGNFALQPIASGFEMHQAKELVTGGLCPQGVYFYGGRVNYHYTYPCDQIPDTLTLNPGAYEATAISLYVNDQLIWQTAHSLSNAIEIAPSLHLGLNAIRIELSSSLKNTFGPHHTPHPIRNSAWPAAWKQAPASIQPPGNQYDCINYGLQDPLLLLH